MPYNSVFQLFLILFLGWNQLFLFLFSATEGTEANQSVTEKNFSREFIARLDESVSVLLSDIKIDLTATEQDRENLAKSSDGTLQKRNVVLFCFVIFILKLFLSYCSSEIFIKFSFTDVFAKGETIHEWSELL